ncbi:MAG: hypothetical protein WAU86_00045 [Oricola sp.]
MTYIAKLITRPALPGGFLFSGVGAAAPKPADAPNGEAGDQRADRGKQDHALQHGFAGFVHAQSPLPIAIPDLTMRQPGLSIRSLDD